MDVTVLATSEDLLTNVRVMVPYHIEEKAFFDLYGNTSRSPLLIQTPNCVLRYKYSLYDDHFFTIDLYTTSHEFKTFMDQFVSLVLTRIRKKYHHLINGKTIVPLITEEGRLRLKTPNATSLRIFDHHKQKIDLHHIQKSDRLQALFQVEKLVSDAKTLSFQVKLLQLKKTTPVINVDESLFKDESPVVQRFRKMLKMGVPLMCVRQKMMLEGHTEEEISEVCGISSSASPPHIPPPPPPPPPIKRHSPIAAMASPAFLKDIASGNFKLKTATATATTTTTNPNKILRFVDKSKMVPTLQEILDAKAKLGKNKVR
jgi:hypothetical protein